MAAVTGIGGFFFRAQDPDALSAWYERHFGINPVSAGPWTQDAGPTVFSPFAQDSDYFAADKVWMLNLRVDDIDRMISTLEENGVAVETRAEWDGEYGRFARVHDPEGNPIELWQPPTGSPAAA